MVQANTVVGLLFFWALKSVSAAKTQKELEKEICSKDKTYCGWDISTDKCSDISRCFTDPGIQMCEDYCAQLKDNKTCGLTGFCEWSTAGICQTLSQCDQWNKKHSTWDRAQSRKSCQDQIGCSWNDQAEVCELIWDNKCDQRSRKSCQNQIGCSWDYKTGVCKLSRDGIYEDLIALKALTRNGRNGLFTCENLSKRLAEFNSVNGVKECGIMEPGCKNALLPVDKKICAEWGAEPFDDHTGRCGDYPLHTNEVCCQVAVNHPQLCKEVYNDKEVADKLCEDYLFLV